MQSDAPRRACDPKPLSLRFRDVLFAHWDVEPSVVAETLPRGLSVDERDGRAWLGVVAFTVSAGPRRLPVRSSFGQVNLRTYVRGPDGTPGVYFYALDVDHRLAAGAGRSLMRLPYHRARVDAERRGRRVRIESERLADAAPPARFRATYGPVGRRSQPAEGSLARFLTERYRLFTEGAARSPAAWRPGARSDDGGARPPRKGRLYRADIDHEPWDLAEATVDVAENGLFAADGFDDPDDDPLCHYCPRKDATAGLLHRA